jgi:hypothetical protein
MFCTYCGEQNPDTVIFCQRCGKQFDRRPGQETKHSSSPSSASTSFMNKTKQQKNRAYVTVIVGAVVALIAYHSLPFVSSYTEFSPIAGTLYNPVATTAEDFGSFTHFSALLTFITLIVATILTLTDNPSGTAKTPLAIQRRRRAINAMIGMSMLGILTYILTITSGGSSFDSIDAGFWIYLVGLGIVIIGSFMALRTLSSPLPLQAQREGEPPPTQLPPQSTTHR